MIPSLWILLDTCLTSSVCNNKKIVGNIYGYTSDENLTMYTNGGSKTFIQIVPFKFLPMEVHFNLDSKAKILVIEDVASIPGVHISMDSRKERLIIVEYQNEIIKFQECSYGL